MQHIESARPMARGARRLAVAALCFGVLGAQAGTEEDFERAGRAHRQGDFATSVAIWTRLAAAGQVDAQYNMGVIHLHGDGVARDYGQAMTWLRRAAEQGDKHAQLQLGGMYLRGDGVAPDPQAAQRWFTAHLAHHQHHAHSAQMQAWRAEAKELLWARDMRESLAANPESAGEVIAALRRRAETVAAREPAPAADVKVSRR